MMHDTIIHGELIPAGQHTCYKAVFWNIEPATLHVVAWLVLWAYAVIRAMERAIALLSAGFLRWFALSAIIAVQPSLWYGFSVMLHYTNDFWYNFYTSQLFFTLTEAAVFATLALLLDRRRGVPPAVWYAACGTAVYHIVQLLLDEGSNMLAGQRVGRGVHMLLGDSTNAVVLWRLRAQCLGDEPPARRAAAVVAAVVAAEWALFNFVFGDAASTGLSTHILTAKAASGAVHDDG